VKLNLVPDTIVRVYDSASGAVAATASVDEKGFLRTSLIRSPVGFFKSASFT
jgi:hypothetical protein